MEMITELSELYFVMLDMMQKALKVQSVICSKERFASADAAKSWVANHGFSTSKIDETSTSYRFRQFDPSYCAVDSVRTIRLTDGVSAVVCQA